MFNLDNHGVVTGRLTDEIKTFINRDGSRRLLFTLAAQDAHRNRSGQKGTQFVQLTAFVPAGRATSIYDNIHKGDKISCAYSLRNNNYTDKAGQAHYDLEVFIEDLKIQEPKSVTSARHANLALATEAAS